jgi:hypothetical protein
VIEYIIVGIVAGVTSNVLSNIVLSRLPSKPITRKEYGFKMEDK